MAENASQMNEVMELMKQASEKGAPKGETKEITPGSNNKEVTGEAKKRVPKEIKDQSTLFVENNIQGNHLGGDTISGKLMKVNSKISQIAGFIVPNSPRIEINVSSTKVSKDEEPERFETKINVKEKFSQQIKGVILNYSPELVARINEEKATRGTTSLTGELVVKRSDGTTEKVARKTPEVFEMEADTIDKSTKILGYQAFIQWLLDYCWFEIQEAPAIFWSYKDKRTHTKDGVKTDEIKEIKSPADLRASQATNYQLTYKWDEVIKRYTERQKKASGQLTASGKEKTVKVPTLKDIYPLSSKYRGRKLAVPGNFIAIKKFEHIATKGAYTPEEQAEMNKKYVREGFSVNNATAFQKKFNNMTAETKERVTINEKGDVTASQFFADSNSLVANQDYLSTINRWWGKVDTLNTLDMKLVKKSETEVKERKDSNGTVRPAYKKYVLDFIQFGKTGNQLSDPEYSKIVAATDNRLTDSDVVKFISTLSSSSAKNPNSRGGINYDVTVSSSQDLIASLNALAHTLRA